MSASLSWLQLDFCSDYSERDSDDEDDDTDNSDDDDDGGGDDDDFCVFEPCILYRKPVTVIRSVTRTTAACSSGHDDYHLNHHHGHRDHTVLLDRS